MTTQPTNLENEGDHPQAGAVSEPAPANLLPLAISYSCVNGSRVSAIDGLNACRRVAARHGQRIPEWLEFVEEAGPPGYERRSAWRRLRVQLRKHDIRTVYVYESNLRLERSKALRRGFRDAGISIRFVTQPRNGHCGWRLEHECEANLREFGGDGV